MSRLSLFLYTFAALIVVSCGTPGDRFKLEGEFRHFNQGELYLYNIYDNTGRMDTIHVVNGRFSYECNQTGDDVYTILFPNYSEIPVFARPGQSITLKADATHLKEAEVKGSDDNDAMTEFRLSTSELTPPEMVKAAKNYILKNPASPVSFYLLNRYFVLVPSPDHQEAVRLMEPMRKAAHDNGRLHVLYEKLKASKSIAIRQKLPAFSAKDTKGTTVGNSYLAGDVNVIYTWAMWNYESQNIQRSLRRMKTKYGNRLSLLAVSLDADKKTGKHVVEHDSVTWSNICDGRMWDTPLVKQLGMNAVPFNLVIDRQGTVVAKGLKQQELEDKIKSLLK